MSDTEARKLVGEISSVSVSTGSTVTPPAPAVIDPTIHDVALMERPEILRGCTYKVKPATSDHALYITINDALFFKGTDHEQYAPFEIFINTKDTSAHQWLTALTRLLSALFRRGGNIDFVVEEFCAIYDPKGGWFEPGGIFIQSVVHQIGILILQHIKGLKLENAYRQEQYLNKLQPMELPRNSSIVKPLGKYCPECTEMAVVPKDGCDTCLSCGAGKCN